MEIEVDIENANTPHEWLGVVTYLSIIRKHPELKVEILELRRIKNRGFYASLIMAVLISGLIGYALGFGIKVLT